MSLNKEEEENIHGYTGDIKTFLRAGDYTSALILVNDLKIYINRLKRSK